MFKVHIMSFYNQQFIILLLPETEHCVLKGDVFSTDKERMIDESHKQAEFPKCL